MKKARILLAVVLCLALLGGCASQGEPKTENSSDGPGALSVFYVQTTASANPLSEFRAKNPDVQLDAVAFNTAAEMEDELIAQMQTGGGPDVILFTHETTLDLKKLAKQGAFADLDAFLEKDESFDAQNYLSAAMQGCRLDEKQVFLPISYCLSSLYANGDWMESLSITKGYSFAEFFGNLAAYSGDNMVLYPVFSPIYEGKEPVLDRVLIQASGYGFEDDTATDPEALKPLVDALRFLYKDQQKEFVTQPEELFIEWYFSHDLSGDFWRRKDLSRPYIGESIASYFLPSLQDPEQLIATISWFGAVNSSSKNPELGYRFIRTFMDCYKLPPKDKVNKAPQNPVNLKILKQSIDDLQQTRSTSKDGTLEIRPLSEQEAEHLLKQISRTTKAVIANQKTENILLESFEAYFLDTNSYEACFKLFENKLKLYRDE